MDKTLVGTEKSAGSVIRRCSVNKVFLKNCRKFTGRYLCWNLILLMKFQVLRLVLLKIDSCKEVFT